MLNKYGKNLSTPKLSIKKRKAKELKMSTLVCAQTREKGCTQSSLPSADNLKIRYSNYLLNIFQAPICSKRF